MTTEPLPAIDVAGGTAFLLEGNVPLLLDGANLAWVVQTGSAEVFAVDLVDGRQAGPRRHVFSAERGCILFGSELQHRGAEVALIAVGLAGTQALQIPLDTLRAQAAAETTRPA